MIYPGTKYIIWEQNYLVIIQTMILKKQTMIYRLQMFLQQRVACWKSPKCNCNSLFNWDCTSKLCITKKALWLIQQCCSKRWSFSILPKQSVSVWYAHTESLLRMFISKNAEFIMEPKTFIADMLWCYWLSEISLRICIYLRISLYLNFIIYLFYGMHN